MLHRAFLIWIFLELFTLPYFVVHSQFTDETDFVEATFQQTFRFTYTKQEEGNCADLTIYSDLLEPALDISEGYLSSLCTVQNPQDQINGQLEVSGASEENRTVFINISLIYDMRENAVYEQCKDLVQKGFERDDNVVTFSFRKAFYPLQCPAISTDKGGVLVDSGYFCPGASRIRTEVQPGGFSHSIYVCTYCPLGHEVIPGAEVCAECQQGFYKDIVTTPSCERCPDNFVTRINGSITRDDCQLRMCKAGSYANIYNNGHCAPCPFGTYQPEKWKEHCISCPGGFTTYQLGADSPDLCLRNCSQGEGLSNLTKTCQPCPRGYYSNKDDPTISKCIKCNDDYITAGLGATSAYDCVIRNCTKMGQYHDIKDNVCRDCPRGQWQNQKWQTSCKPCDVGFTTRFTGTSHPAYCFIPEDEEGLKFTKEEIILFMSTVLAVLILGNLIIVGYCVHTRRHRQTESFNPTEPEGLKAVSHRESWDHENIEVYDIIRDVLPSPANGTVTTFKPEEETSQSSHDYDDLNMDLESNMNTEPDETADTEVSDASLDEPVYDDVVNTCPIYQNLGFESSSIESHEREDSWSSRLDVLY